MNKTDRATAIFLAALLVMTLIIGAGAYNAVTAQEDERWIKADENKRIAHEMAECARALGYQEDSVIIREASARWWQEDGMQKQIEAEYQIEEDKWSKMEAEYPVATQVWRYLTEDMALPDICAAGILGNMMVECGGFTLDLDPYSRYQSYYGLCQWTSIYYPEIHGADVETQLDFLADGIEKEFQTFGGQNAWDDFLNSERVFDAAYAFNKYYERGVWHWQRNICSTIAYQYYTGEVAG